VAKELIAVSKTMKIATMILVIFIILSYKSITDYCTENLPHNIPGI